MAFIYWFSFHCKWSTCDRLAGYKWHLRTDSHCDLNFNTFGGILREDLIVFSEKRLFFSQVTKIIWHSGLWLALCQKIWKFIVIKRRNKRHLWCPNPSARLIFWCGDLLCKVTTWCMQFQRCYHIHKADDLESCKRSGQLVWDFDVEKLPEKLHDIYNSWGVITFIWQFDLWLGWKFKKVDIKFMQHFNVKKIPVHLQHNADTLDELSHSKGS